jgi:MFS family permease
VGAPNPLRTNRDFRLLWGGQTISVLGSRASALAFPLLVLSLTDSPARAGVVAFSATLPFLVWQLPAGGLVDRWDRKRTMIWCELGRGAAVVSVPIALWLERLTFAQIVGVAFVEGSLFVLFNLAENAAIPKIVSAQELPRSLAQNEAGTRGSALAGGPVAGLLFRFAPALPFVFDAISFVVSVGTVAAIRSGFRTDAPRKRERLHREVAEGFRWLWANPFIRATSLMFAGVNVIVNALMLAVVVVARDRGAAAPLIGVVYGFVGVGGLLGAGVATRAQRALSPTTIVVGTTWLMAVLVAAMALPAPPLVLGPLIGALAFTVPPLSVLVGTYELSLIPDRLLGRVESVILLLAWGSIPIGPLVAGVLLEWLSPARALLTLAGLMGLVAGASTLSPSLRDVPPLRASTPSAKEPVPAGV